MGIPISPNDIPNPIVFPINNQVFNFKACQMPPAGEGPRFMPVQIPVQSVNGSLAQFLIDINNLPAPPISQLASIYVDAQKTSGDVTILFESGYRVSVQAGDASLFPVLADSGKLPRFWVIPTIPAHDGDIINLFLINQFIPEFGTNFFQKVTLFGTDALGILSEAISMPAETIGLANPLTDLYDLTGYTAPINLTGGLITNPAIWGIQLYIDGQTTAGSGTQSYYIALGFGVANTVFSVPFLLNETEQVIKIAELSELRGIVGFETIRDDIFLTLLGDVTKLQLGNLFVNLQLATNNDNGTG